MPQVLDIEQSLLLLELEPPFDKRACSSRAGAWPRSGTPTSRRPGKQFEHERHLKAINEAADQLEQLAEELARRARQPQRRQGQRRRRAQARAPRRAAAPTRPSSAPRRRRRPRQARPVRRPRARPLGRAPLRALPLLPGVGRRHVTGIYFTGDGDDVQQWARVKFQVGVRTIPAGSLQFVDFSKPDPGAERVQRFMTAAQHAMAEGDYELAAQRLIYARDAEPDNLAVLRLMTLAFWQAGNLPAAGRAVRDWARVEAERPDAASLRRAHLRGHGRDRPRRPRPPTASPTRAPADADRLGARRPPAPAPDATARPRGRRSRRRRALEPSVEALLDLALVHHLTGDVGGEVSARRAGRRRSSPKTPRGLGAPRPRARAHRPRHRGDRRVRARARAQRRRRRGRASCCARLRDALPRVLPAA